MKKGNIIELAPISQVNRATPYSAKSLPISDELKTAIEELIYRMRYLGPILPPKITQ